MTREAWKCADPNCKGHVVFENADFNFSEIPEINGSYAFDNPRCTECDREHLVVPSYTVGAFAINGDFIETDSTCIKNHERRLREIAYEKETSPYQKIKKYIDLIGVTYTVEDIQKGHQEWLDGIYISYSMKHCVKHLENELKMLAGY